MSSTGYFRKSLISFSQKETEWERSSDQGHKAVQVPLTSRACLFHSPMCEREETIICHCFTVRTVHSDCPWDYRLQLKYPTTWFNQRWQCGWLWLPLAWDQDTAAHNVYFTITMCILPLQTSSFPLQINQQFWTIGTAPNSDSLGYKLLDEPAV